jgi:glycosyltransferase involved in cell wall biosynthesis
VLGAHDGVDRLIEAVASIDREHVPPFELVVVGDGPALDELRSLAGRRGVADLTRFVGFLSGERREAALTSFDIAVIPDPVNRFTASSSMNKAFAYAAHGRAVISTPLAQTRRLLPAARFAADDRPVSIAAELERVLRDPPLRRQLGQAARQIAEEKFDWPGAAARYVSAMTALLPTLQK